MKVDKAIANEKVFCEDAAGLENIEKGLLNQLLLNNKIYLKYILKRPGVEKINTHGLFDFGLCEEELADKVLRINGSDIEESREIVLDLLIFMNISYKPVVLLKS